MNFTYCYSPSQKCNSIITKELNSNINIEASRDKEKVIFNVRS